MMKRMPTTVTTPDAYVEALSGWQRAYVAALRTAVQAAAPALREQLKWGHLVYLHKGPVLLLRAEPERVLFGFWRGRRLLDIEPRLKPGGKYEMATLALHPDTPLRRETVQALVQEAARLDRELGDPTAVAAVGMVDAYIRPFLPTCRRCCSRSARQLAPPRRRPRSASATACPRCSSTACCCTTPRSSSTSACSHRSPNRVLREKAARYAGPKGNLQLPLNEPMPLELISEIVRTRLQANRARRGTPQGRG